MWIRQGFFRRFEKNSWTEKLITREKAQKLYDGVWLTKIPHIRLFFRGKNDRIRSFFQTLKGFQANNCKVYNWPKFESQGGKTRNSKGKNSTLKGGKIQNPRIRQVQKGGLPKIDRKKRLGMFALPSLTHNIGQFLGNTTLSLWCGFEYLHPKCYLNNEWIYRGRSLKLQRHSDY